MTTAYTSHNLGLKLGVPYSHNL